MHGSLIYASEYFVLMCNLNYLWFDIFLQEAVNCIKQLCLKYFSQQKQKDIEELVGMLYHTIVSIIYYYVCIGKVIYEAVGLQKLYNAKKIFSVLVNAVKRYTKQVLVKDQICQNHQYAHIILKLTSHTNTHAIVPNSMVATCIVKISNP